MERGSMIVLMIIAVLIATSVYIFYPKTSAVPAGKYDDFAKCLTQKGAIMHGTDWCSHCADQKAMFGSSFSYIYFINCDYDKQACVEAGVSGYPTWKINGMLYPGTRSLEELSALSGCELG